MTALLLAAAFSLPPQAPPLACCCDDCRCGDVCDCGEGPLAPVAFTKKLPHLVYVGAGWCGPCKRKGLPEVEFLRENGWEKKITVRDFDEFPRFAEKHGVELVPCYLLFDERGEVLDRHYGAMDRWEVAKFYNGENRMLAEAAP